MYQRSVEYNPSAAGSWVNLGSIEFGRRNIGRAEECYRRALAVDPVYQLGLFNLAYCLDEMGNHNQAIKHYREALKYRPDYADAHFNLAEALERQGDWREALDHYRVYLSLDVFNPTSRWRQVAKGQVEALKARELRPVRVPKLGEQAVGS